MSETSLNLGIIILEPMTAATDLLLAAFCIYFYKRLRLPSPSEPLLKFWRLFFLILGISTILGTIAHGLRLYMSDKVFQSVWMAMNLSSIMSSYFLLMATIEMVRKSNPQLMRRYQLGALIGTLLITAATVALNEFSLIKIYAGIVVLVALYRNYTTFKQGVRGSGLIAFGFVLSILPIIVHTAKLSFNEYFNFKDLSHVIMMVSLYFIFMGAMISTRLVGSSD